MSKITCVRLGDSPQLRNMRAEYLRTLSAPMDGMWESAVVGSATHRELRYESQRAGYFCIDSNGNLVRFHILPPYLPRGEDLFRWVISAFEISRAIVGTIEPWYLSLCLDLQAHVAVHSYLFRDAKLAESPIRPESADFRRAEESQTNEYVRFYRQNSDGPGDWTDEFLRLRIRQGELFGRYDGRTLVAAGECIPSQSQTPYADLGVIVARPHRGRGLGSAMLVLLKEYCHASGWEPICSCAAGNLASKKAIGRAGFISEHRMVEVALSADRARV